MNLVIAFAVAALTGGGIFLMLRHDIVKLVAGTLMLSNAVVLFLVAATFETHVAPIEPMEPGPDVADPLVQALALTAVVITFAVTVLLLAIALAVERSHDTIDMDEIVSAEVGGDDAEETS